MVDEPGWKFFPEHSTPVVPLDVVWCHFPEIEHPDDPGPKLRPALVRQTFERQGHIYVEVAYGTSNAARYSTTDLWVANFRDMMDAGLPQATIFSLDRTVRLPWAEEWFAKRADGTGPVIGHLNRHSQEYLRKLVAFRRRQRN